MGEERPESVSEICSKLVENYKKAVEGDNSPDNMEKLEERICPKWKKNYIKSISERD